MLPNAARTVTAATVSLGALLLTGCQSAPNLSDQTGKTYAKAYKVADKAGYELIQASVEDGTLLDYNLASELDELPDRYKSWTVCSTDSNHVDDDGDGFWSVDFYMVKVKEHCKDGRLTDGREDEYKTLAKEAEAAEITAEGEEEVSGVPSDQFSGTDEAEGENPPLALDLSWLAMSDSDRAYMCQRYQEEPDYIAELLVSMIKEPVTLSQAHAVFRTNC